MKNKNKKQILFGLVVLSSVATALGQEEKKSSYLPVVPQEQFSNTMARMAGGAFAVGGMSAANKTLNRDNQMSSNAAKKREGIFVDAHGNSVGAIEFAFKIIFLPSGTSGHLQE